MDMSAMTAELGCSINYLSKNIHLTWSVRMIWIDIMHHYEFKISYQLHYIGWKRQDVYPSNPVAEIVTGMQPVLLVIVMTLTFLQVLR